MIYLVKKYLFVILLFTFWNRAVTGSKYQINVLPEEKRSYQKGSIEEFYCCGYFPPGGSLMFYQVYDKNHTYLSSNKTTKCGQGYNGLYINKTINILDHNTRLYCVYWEKKGEYSRYAEKSNSITLRLYDFIPQTPQPFETNRSYVTITPTYPTRLQVGTAVSYKCILHNIKTENVDLYQEMIAYKNLTAYQMKRQTSGSYYYDKNVTETDNNSKIYCVATFATGANFITSKEIDLIVESSIQTSDFALEQSSNKSELSTREDDKTETGFITYILPLVLMVILICLIVTGLVIVYKRRRRPEVKTQEAQSDAVTYAELSIRPPTSGNLKKEEDTPQYAQIMGVMIPKKKR